MNAIIDIGSNSVRMLLDGKKTVINTKLAENSLTTRVLTEEAMRRTADAVFTLADEARAKHAEIFPFATEAVRSALNKETFLGILAERGVKVHVLDSQTEAIIGFEGAICEAGTNAVLDVGGASSELAIGSREKIIYTHSLPLGSVRMKDYSSNRAERIAYAKEMVKEYGKTPKFEKLVSIGGTSSSLVAVRDKLEPYDPEKVHNSVLTRKEIEDIVTYILSYPLSERKNIVGLHPLKTEVIPAGGDLIGAIMDFLGVEKITVSERDNLEGYESHYITHK